jgi:hypothetical protein
MTAERVYATLLRLYPKSFREEFGADMLADFGDLRRARRLTALTFWRFILVDTLYSAARQRIDLARWLAMYGIGLLATVGAAQFTSSAYGYFYHPYLEGWTISVLPYGIMLGLVLGGSITMAQRVIAPALVTSTNRWMLASAVVVPVTVLFCTAAIDRALAGVNPVAASSHVAALTVILTGLVPMHWTDLAMQFAAMAASALLVRHYVY